MNKTIIVKVGTESLANFHTSVKVGNMVRDIARLMREKIRVVLISSGAVGCGKEILWWDKNNQVYASVGQPVLMGRYAEKFQKRKIVTAQILPTHATLEDIESHRTQFIRTVNDIIEAGVLPIINENDALSTAEMQALGRGADNDQNALLIARILGATDIILLTNTNGVYRDKNDSSSRIKILRAKTITDEWIHRVCGGKSASWTGGMQSKVIIGREFAKNGGVTHVCDGIHSTVYEHALGRDIHGGTHIKV